MKFKIITQFLVVFLLGMAPHAYASPVLELDDADWLPNIKTRYGGAPCGGSPVESRDHVCLQDIVGHSTRSGQKVTETQFAQASFERDPVRPTIKGQTISRNGYFGSLPQTMASAKAEVKYQIAPKIVQDRLAPYYNLYDWLGEGTFRNFVAAVVEKLTSDFTPTVWELDATLRYTFETLIVEHPGDPGRSMSAYSWGGVSFAASVSSRGSIVPLNMGHYYDIDEYQTINELEALEYNWRLLGHTGPNVPLTRMDGVAKEVKFFNRGTIFANIGNIFISEMSYGIFTSGAASSVRIEVDPVVYIPEDYTIEVQGVTIPVHDIVTFQVSPDLYTSVAAPTPASFYLLVLPLAGIFALRRIGVTTHPLYRCANRDSRYGWIVMPSRSSARMSWWSWC